MEMKQCSLVNLKSRAGVAAVCLCFVLLFAVALQGSLVDVVLSVVSAVLLALLVRIDSREKPEIEPEVRLIRSEVEDLKRARLSLEERLDERFGEVHERVRDLDARIGAFEHKMDGIELMMLRNEQNLRSVRGWAAAGSAVAVIACIIPFFRSSAVAVPGAQLSSTEPVKSAAPAEHASVTVPEAAPSQGKVSFSGLEPRMISPVLEPVAYVPAPAPRASRARRESIRTSSTLYRASADGAVVVEDLDGRVRGFSLVRARG